MEKTPRNKKFGISIKEVNYEHQINELPASPLLTNMVKSVAESNDGQLIKSETSIWSFINRNELCNERMPIRRRFLGQATTKTPNLQMLQSYYGVSMLSPTLSDSTPSFSHKYAPTSASEGPIVAIESLHRLPIASQENLPSKSSKSKNEDKQKKRHHSSSEIHAKKAKANTKAMEKREMKNDMLPQGTTGSKDVTSSLGHLQNVNEERGTKTSGDSSCLDLSFPSSSNAAISFPANNGRNPQTTLPDPVVFSQSKHVSNFVNSSTFDPAKGQSSNVSQPSIVRPWQTHDKKHKKESAQSSQANESSGNFVIPLVNTSHLNNDQRKTLTDIGIDTFIPVEGLINMGIPVFKMFSDKSINCTSIKVGPVHEFPKPHNTSMNNQSTAVGSFNPPQNFSGVSNPNFSNNGVANHVGKPISFPLAIPPSKPVYSSTNSEILKPPTFRYGLQRVETENFTFYKKPDWSK